MRKRTAAGFTLIEVMIALFVIALGLGALLTTLGSAADNVGYLRDKSFAEWVALNRVSEVRLDSKRPAPGVVTGEAEYAGTKWKWQQKISDQGMAGILRIDIAVARSDSASQRTSAAASAAGNATEAFPALATAYGFLGTSVAPPNDVDPDWSLAAAAGGGGTGGSGNSGGSGSGAKAPP